MAGERIGMKGKFSIQQRLILPIILLGAVALVSNALAVFSIHNVNSNASNIVDNYMVGKTQLAEIRRSTMNIHKMALSHIVATDYGTMTDVVRQIKQEEENLETYLEAYSGYVDEEESAVYQDLLNHYDSFKHALVFLVCASADSKTEEAYALANGDVASYGSAIESDIAVLYDSITARTESARQRLLAVYIISLVISGVSMAACVLLALAAVRMIMEYVVKPIKSVMATLQESSERVDAVVGEVRQRTRTSSKSARDLSVLAERLSGAIRQVAGNASSINGNAADMKGDVNTMAEECAAITEYSMEMKERADNMEQSARMNAETISAKVADMLAVLEEAIENSRSVDQVSVLAKAILEIAANTNLIAVNASIEAARAGEAGEGFAVVAQEIRQLADSCGETAGHIQEINKNVTGAVYDLSGSVQELVDYLNQSILTEFREFVASGQQYHEDAAYIEAAMDKFNQRAERLRGSMNEIASSIERITKALDDGAAGITGVAGSTRSMVGNMTDIASRMDTNKEIVEELKKQTELFANL